MSENPDVGETRGVANRPTALDPAAIVRGALAGFVVIVPVTVARVVVSHHVTNLDHSAWSVPFALGVLVAYAVAGWVAGSSAPEAPLGNGALAAITAVVLWQPVRVVIWLIRHDHPARFTSGRVATTAGELFGAFVLGAAIGMIAAVIAARRASRPTDGI